MNKPRIYIGIETKVREFDSKLLLACAAAEAGHDVILGSLKMLRKRLPRMPRGIFFEKSVSPESLPDYRRYRNLGFAVIGYDEEGLAPWNAEVYQGLRRFSNETLTPLESFLAWGDWHAELVTENAPSQREKVLAVGHPRIDLTRKDLRSFYQTAVQELRDTYGPFILLNTNFSICNHFYGRDGLFDLYRKSGRQFSKPVEAYYRKLQQHQEQLLTAFTEMILQLRQRFPSMTLVLRPHPSENHTLWQERFAQDSLVKVVHEGNVLPWLLAAEVMIHNSCTTGIEAYLLDRPVISFRPVEDTSCENYLPNVLSMQEVTLESLLQTLDVLFTDGRLPQERDESEKKHRIAASYITGIEGEWSCDRIVKALDDIQIPQKNLQLTYYHMREKMRKGKAFLRKHMKRNRPIGPALGNARQRFLGQKFPGIDSYEVAQAVERFQTITGRFLDIQVVELGENIFHFCMSKERRHDEKP